MSELAPGEAALRGRAVVLRPAGEADLPRFLEILRDPVVAAWWGEYDEARLRRDVDPGSGGATFAIEAGGDVAGLIQYWQELDPHYRHAGIDIALHPRWHGRGLGTDALRTLARHLFDDLGHHRLTIDPARANAGAVRAYERVGFRVVGVMRQYERGPDGGWRDGLLMDMLRHELTPDVG